MWMLAGGQARVEMSTRGWGGGGGWWGIGVGLEGNNMVVAWDGTRAGVWGGEVAQL